MSTIIKTSPWIALALLAVFPIAAWKMLDYRARWHAETSNLVHEMRLADAGILSADRVLLFGDSQIAYWPMAQSFGVMPVVNRGKGGDWATNAQERYAKALVEVNPQTVVLLIGTNDIGNGKTLGELEASLAEMVDAASGRHVILCSILPVRGSAQEKRPPSKIREMNQRLRMLAEAKGIRYLDLYTPLSGPDGLLQQRYSTDDLHISREGYVVMTRVLLRELRG